MSVLAIHARMVEPVQTVSTSTHVVVLQDMKEHIVKRVSKLWKTLHDHLMQI